MSSVLMSLTAFTSVPSPVKDARFLSVNLLALEHLCTCLELSFKSYFGACPLYDCWLYKCSKIE